jgi:hypothetical protein
MRRLLILCAWILGTCGIALACLDILFTWAITAKPLSGIRERRHYDLLIAGDSRTNALLPGYLDMITGLRTINIGTPSLNLEDNHRIMEYFFERGNTVDQVALQIDLRFGTARRAVKDWEYEPYLIRQKGLLSPRVPFLFYAKHNQNITLHKVWKGISHILEDSKEDPGLDTMKVLHDFRPFLFNERLLADHSCDPFLMDELKDFERYLKRNGVKQLILFTAPFSPNWFSSQTDTTLYKKRLREAGYTYHDFSTIYRDTSYFKDYTHIKNNRYLEFCREFRRVVLQPAMERRQAATTDDRSLVP